METMFNASMPVEESESISQLLGPYPFSIEQDISSLLWSDHDPYYSSSQDQNSSLYYLSQLESNVSSISTHSFFDPPFDYQACNNYERMNLVPINSYRNQDCLNEETSSLDIGDYVVNSSERVVTINRKPQHKRNFSMAEVDKPTDDYERVDTATNNPKKKAKVASQVQKNAKSTKSKKSHPTNASSEEKDNNISTLNVQCSSSSSLEDDSNTSQEPKEPAALNLNGKSRANRGSATDPQSLYARKRRERINERIRVLQNLVPNGTKVDISTMLEEAVQYVKFLQLQIKLLSSDDLWMYAPLANNGMDVCLNLKISQHQ